MSVRGYLRKITADLKMPKTEIGRPGSLGIRYHGPVLSGHMSVGDAFARQNLSLMGQPKPKLPVYNSNMRWAQPPKPADYPYSPYDPRVTPAPRVAPYPANCYNPPAASYVAPCQYDAVLRYHLRLDPPPTPKP